MTTAAKKTPDAGEERVDARKPYVAPAVRRVNLAIEETLSSGCKLVEACDAPPEPDEEAGS